MEERKVKKKTKFLDLSEIKVFLFYTKRILYISQIQSTGLSPAQLFMALNEAEIARQLTIIEFNIFSKIKVIFFFF